MIRNVKTNHDKISKRGNHFTTHSNLIFETFEHGVRNDNGFSVKQLLQMYEGWTHKKNFFTSLNCFDSQWSWKIKKEGRYIPRNAGNAFDSYYLAILKNHGYTEFDFFDETTLLTKEKLFSDPSYTTTHALEDFLKAWNDPQVKIAGHMYSPFEVYVAAWKWFQVYAPYNEGFGRVTELEFKKPLSEENLKICQQNILFHCAKWVQGYMAEGVTIEVVKTIAQKNPEFNEEIREVEDALNQKSGIDLIIGEDKVSIKSGQTLATDIFKELPTDYTLGPVFHSHTGDERAHMVFSYGKNGIKVSHKGFVFEGFIHYNLQTGQKRCMVGFIKERTGQNE